MSEINNNKINLNQVQNSGIKKNDAISQKPVGVYFEYTNFDNPRAESLGRSQVSPKIDNIESNLAYMMKNPEAVKQANTFFDNAYETLKAGNIEDAYEKAATQTGAFKEEFLKP